MKINPMAFVIVAIVSLLAALTFACGSSGDEEMLVEERAEFRESMGMDRTIMGLRNPFDDSAAQGAVAPAPAAPAAAQMITEQKVIVEREVAAPQAPAAAAPAPRQDARETVVMERSDGERIAQLVSQRRIIIRTVNMGIVVDEIQAAIDQISELADSLGGWVVSTDRQRKHAGSVSVRVPAEELDSAIESLRLIAKDVESEISSSQDVTDEYFDLHSRLKNQQATEAALIKLMDRAASVEHALAVQRELSSVQENVERLLGRIKLLEETSAYSLITVHLSLAPLDMSVDAGPDQSVAAYNPIRFKATFKPPEGMDENQITWDFGDGSEPVTTRRSAPTTNEGERVTATVTHSYDDPRDSPFIVQATISSYGDSGVAEGEDTLIVTVSETPVIEVFAGEREYRALQRETVEFSGSFTRPAGLSDVRYEWDFGDGSRPEVGDLAEGVTRVDATHVYADYRATPYRTRFTITADSAVGEIVSFHEILVWVGEDPGLIAGGFDIGETSKTAVRTLSVVISSLTTLAIWLGVFGVIWVPVAVLIVILVRRGRRFRAERSPSGLNPTPPTPNPGNEPGPEGSRQ